MPLSTPTLPVGPIQVANATTNVILERRARLANQPRAVGLEIAVLRQGSGNSFTTRINERSALTGVAAFAVGANAPEARSTLTPSEITAELHGLMAYIRDDAALVSAHSEVLAYDEALRMAWAQYWSAETLAQFANVTAVTGTAATTNDYQNWDTVTQAFRGQSPPAGMRWAVLHGDAVRDLKASLFAAGASVFGSMFGERKADALVSTTNGLGVPFDGYMLYESNEVPAGDTTGWTNCLGVKSDANPVDSGLAIMVHLASRVRYQRDESSVGAVQVISGITGVGIQAQGSLRAFITRT